MSKQKVLKKDVQAAEKAAQRSVCNLPDGPLPEDLKKALERRVDVSWDAAQTSGVLRRLGGADEKVRSLEQPWSKRTHGRAQQSAPAEPSPQSRGRSANQSTDDPAADDTTQEGTD